MSPKLSIITATYNRASLLSKFALPSILNQSEKNFEWIVVNDGKDPKTRDLIESLNVDFNIIYLEMEHLELGFSMCAAKNLALKHANTPYIGYVDDDNRLLPNYSKSVVESFENNSCAFLMTQQNRWQHVFKNGSLQETFGPKVSPIESCKIKDLVIPNKDSYFDSNGFAHLKENAPAWDVNYRVFCDYTYLLRSIEQWGDKSFLFVPSVQVDYIQTSEGIIGTSDYGMWAEEFKRIWADSKLNRTLCMYDDGLWFPKYIKHFENKAKLSS